MNDPEFVYLLEVRIMDLEKKVEELEEQVEARQPPSASKLPSSVLSRIENGEHAVRVLREHHALTQKQLGEKCNMWPNHISSIERGQSFSLKTARRLAEALDVQPRFLMGYSK